MDLYYYSSKYYVEIIIVDDKLYTYIISKSCKQVNILIYDINNSQYSKQVLCQLETSTEF
jgi:hypothetical protein